MAKSVSSPKLASSRYLTLRAILAATQPLLAGEGADAAPWSFYFRDDPGGRPHAFHVLRAQFDHLRHRVRIEFGVELTRPVGPPLDPERVAAVDEGLGAGGAPPIPVNPNAKPAALVRSSIAKLGSLPPSTAVSVIA